MDFTIIGAGNMGRAIATRLLSGDNSVVIIDRDHADARNLTDELRAKAKGSATVTAEPMGSQINSEAVILSVNYASIPEVLSQYGDQLSGKILVDISNPLNESFDDLATPPGTSSAEETAKAAPSGAKVVKAFNTTFSRTLMSGQVEGESLDVFLAGDDQQAKERLSKAFNAAGLRPIDVGPLKRARQLEGLGLLHIVLQRALGTNYDSSVKILG